MRNIFLILVVYLISACFASSNEVMFGIQEQKMIHVSADSSIPQYLYKIVTPEDWQKSQGQQFVVASSMDSEFIHLATKEQVSSVAQKFWSGKNYVVLTLDSKKLKGRLVYEANPGRSTKYYHLYDGKIPLSAVVDSSQEMITK